jgi:glucose/mannose-6-phosphate isomerase
MMEKAIRDFPKQFVFEPVVERSENFAYMKQVIVSGMGGSHLAADLLLTVYPTEDIRVHAGYGLPQLPSGVLRNYLFIASSYSGNTEECIDSLEQAQSSGLTCAALSIGGKLEKFARQHSLAYCKLPNTGIQPRSALGFSLLGIMKLIGMDNEIQKLHTLADSLQPDELEARGNELAKTIHGCVPVIYASHRNKAIANTWKIKFNETAKIPAFYNVFSELNHNEMTGYDMIPETQSLSQKFHFIFLCDDDDDPRIQKRMKICKQLYEKRGLPVTEVCLLGSTRWERIFNSLLMADWFAYYSGTMYGVETEQVPMVEEFKKLIINQ